MPEVGDWPTGNKNPDLLTMHPSHGHDMTIVNGISRIGWMTGGKSALWNDEDMADLFAAGRDLHRAEPQHAVLSVLRDARHARATGAEPAFRRLVGHGPRGDALVEGDWSVGRILETLDRLKLADRTLSCLP